MPVGHFIALFAGLALWLCSGCAGLRLPPSKESMNKSMQEDDKYYASYLRYNRTHTVYDNFETEFSISTTLLAPDFRAAFSERYREVFGGDRPFLEESNEKLGFFVTIYQPKQNKNELDKEGIWNISAQLSGQTFKPILIKNLSEKARWKLFF